MMATDMVPDDKLPLLDFESAHDSELNTILLLHGAGASGHDWDIVQPHLSSYHLLMPSFFTTRSIELARRDLASSSSGSANWQPAYMHLLANLVKSRAKNGRAHVVGLSLGASMAIGFANAYPDLVLSLFATGTPPSSSSSSSTNVDDKQQLSPSSSSTSSSSWTSSLYSAGLLGVFRLQESVSPKTAQRLMDGEVLLGSGGWDGKGSRATAETVRITMDNVRGCRPGPLLLTTNTLMSSTTTAAAAAAAEAAKKPLRVYIVAATRSKWWMPTADSVTWAVEVAQRLSGRHGSSSFSPSPTPPTPPPTDPSSSVTQGTPLLEVKALEAPGMFHPWSRQAPEVFARCVLAAAEGSPLPMEHLKVVWEYDG